MKHGTNAKMLALSLGSTTLVAALMFAGQSHLGARLDAGMGKGAVMGDMPVKQDVEAGKPVGDEAAVSDTAELSAEQLAALDAGETVVVITEDTSEDAGTEIYEDGNDAGQSDGGVQPDGGGDAAVSDGPSSSGTAGTCSNIRRTKEHHDYTATAYLLVSAPGASQLAVENAAKAEAQAKFNQQGAVDCQTWAQSGPPCVDVPGPPRITCVRLRDTGTARAKNPPPANPSLTKGGAIVMLRPDDRRAWKAEAKFFGTCDAVRECVARR